MLLTIHVTDTITIGTLLVGAIIALPALYVVFKGARWKGIAETAEETAKVYAEGREAYRLKSERLENELKELLILVGEQKQVIAKLEAMPNLTVLQEQMGKLAEQATRAILKGLEQHEERAEHRHEALVTEQEKSSSRAQTRHEKIIGLVGVVGDTLADLAAEVKTGKGHE